MEKSLLNKNSFEMTFLSCFLLFCINYHIGKLPGRKLSYWLWKLSPVLKIRMCYTKFHQSSTAFRNIGKFLCCLLLLDCLFSNTMCLSKSSLIWGVVELSREVLSPPASIRDASLWCLLSQWQRWVFLACECSERKTLFGCWGRWEAAAAFQSTNVGLSGWSPQHNADASN